MLAPDLVQPRKVASAVVISSSLSSVTFPDPSPGGGSTQHRQPPADAGVAARRRAEPPPGGWPPGLGRRARLGRLGAPRWRGDEAGQAGLEARPMSTSEPGPADPAAGASGG